MIEVASSAEETTYSEHPSKKQMKVKQINLGFEWFNKFQCIDHLKVKIASKNELISENLHSSWIIFKVIYKVVLLPLNTSFLF